MKRHDRHEKKRKTCSCSGCGCRNRDRSDDSSNWSSYEEPRHSQPPCYVPAPRLGACCRNGLCSIEEERVCLGTGGFWFGIGKTCAQVRCPDQPAGACCFGGGRCGIMSERNCEDAGGMWMGPFSSCNQCNPDVAAIYATPMTLLQPNPVFYAQGGNLPLNPNLALMGPCGNPGFGRQCNSSDAGFVAQPRPPPFNPFFLN